ncbi:hypothetical protein [Streptomyces sp. NPDC059783]|uniref:hypothetical protein n=1 Tax=Streptomyces sp. NPDC059783 TaxID=3346944 RepID=UPI0036540E10
MSDLTLWAIEQRDDAGVWQQVLLLPTYIRGFELEKEEARRRLHVLVALNPHLPWRPVEVTRRPDGTETTAVLAHE